jgi:hypothetical protein
MPATAYTANLMAKANKHGTAYQGAATVYLALVTTVPSKTVAGTEVTLGAYERVTWDMTTKWDDDDAGKLTSNADAVYPECSADYDDDVVAVEAWSAATNGTRLWFIILQSPMVFVSGMTPKFFAGDLVLEHV